MHIEFTLHAKERLRKRKISEEEVIRAVISPDKLVKEFEQYYARKNIGRGNIEVVYVRESYIKVLTVYWI